MNSSTAYQGRLVPIKVEENEDLMFATGPLLQMNSIQRAGYVKVFTRNPEPSDPSIGLHKGISFQTI
ncbi:hypothetical protein AAFF_G00272440 [Aldrovandia affinis]|uniref:Uncharacterized protein n=1 Tax=Aldrovandia affinis TaxID=143900 RepID=A0AAD7W283_9TELE|nr:hypothetical protein AAFF_G00272440 [Aldrovandia affinis]